MWKRSNFSIVYSQHSRSIAKWWWLYPWSLRISKTHMPKRRSCENFDFTFFRADSFALTRSLDHQISSNSKLEIVSWEACSTPIISENFHLKSQLAHCIFASDVVAVCWVVIFIWFVNIYEIVGMWNVFADSHSISYWIVGEYVQHIRREKKTSNVETFPHHRTSEICWKIERKENAIERRKKSLKFFVYFSRGEIAWNWVRVKKSYAIRSR